MSKAGNSQLRKHLFFPAMSAMRYNTICKEFAARLKAQGKPQIKFKFPDNMQKKSLSSAGFRL
jgi:hypothetical protein